MKNMILVASLGIGSLIGFTQLPSHPWQSLTDLHGREFHAGHFPGKSPKSALPYIGHSDPMSEILGVTPLIHHHQADLSNENPGVVPGKFITDEQAAVNPEESSLGSMTLFSNSGAGKADEEINNEFASQEESNISIYYAGLINESDASLNGSFYDENASIDMNMESLALTSDASMNENFSAENHTVSLTSPLLQADEEINALFHSENK